MITDRLLIISSGGGYRHYKIVDYLKGFSITTIVLMHLIQGYITGLPDKVYTMASIGGSGVHIFFFCSGLCLYLSYLGKPKTYMQFIRSRFKKIYLPYIAVVLLSFLIPAMYEGTDRFMALLSHVFFFKMFVARYESSFGTQLWFMSTIIQFYLVFIPLCHIRVYMKTSFRFMVFGTAVSVAYWVLVAVFKMDSIRIWSSFFLQYLWEFCLGMCVAERLFHGESFQIDRRLLFIVAIAGIGIQTLMALHGNRMRMFNDIPAMFGYGALALFLYSCPVIDKVFTKIGRFSYEWYLIHILVITCVFCTFPIMDGYGNWGIGVIALLLSATAAWGYSRILHKNVEAL